MFFVKQKIHDEILELFSKRHVNIFHKNISTLVANEKSYLRILKKMRKKFGRKNNTSSKIFRRRALWYEIYFCTLTWSKTDEQKYVYSSANYSALKPSHFHVVIEAFVSHSKNIDS